MHNIILIGTLHMEMGQCNAEQLHRILEDISPEVIFHELPKSLFDIVYQ